MAGSNSIEGELRTKLGQTLSKLDQVDKKIDGLGKRQKDVNKQTSDFGSKSKAAMQAAVTGATALIGALSQVLKAFDQIDQRLAKLSGQGGASSVGLSSTLSGLGIRDGGRTARGVRRTTGVASQSDLDAFVGQLGETNAGIAAPRLLALTQAFARGKPLLGSGKQLGLIENLSQGKLKGSDVADLSVLFGESSGGQGLTATSARGVQKLVGQGVPLSRALALAAGLTEAGQERGLSSIASELARGTSLDDVLAGKSKSPEVQAAIGALASRRGGRGVEAVAGIERDFARALQPGVDVVGQRLAELGPEANRELSLRRRERQDEVNRNIDIDRGTGSLERARAAEIDNLIESYERAGDDVQAAATRAFRTTFGDAATELRLGIGDRVQQRATPIEVRVTNPSPDAGQ